MRALRFLLCLLPMTCLPLTLLASEPPGGQAGGRLTGQFLYNGTPPAREPLELNKDVEFCGGHHLRDDSLVVGPDGGIRHVIVWLDTKASGRTPPGSSEVPGTNATPAPVKLAPVTLDNRGCRFEPHVVLLQTGQPLVIKNSDPIAHNTAAFLNKNLPFNVATPPQGEPVSQTLDQPERLPVQIACPIHPWMRAWLLVQDHPYMAVSDTQGRFTIDNLPPGEWTFVAWHERAGYLSHITRGDTSTAWEKGRFTVTIPEAGATDLGPVRVASQTFRE